MSLVRRESLIPSGSGGALGELQDHLRDSVKGPAGCLHLCTVLSTIVFQAPTRMTS